MSLKIKITSILKEAELYREQGLFIEAKGKYENLREIIYKNKSIKNRKRLLAKIEKRILTLQLLSKQLSTRHVVPQLSPDTQDLISKLFSFSKSNTKGGAVIEGALALAKFGQYNRAMQDLRNIVGEGANQVSAAKSILCCLILQSSVDAAIEQYRTWWQQKFFQPDVFEKLRVFLEAKMAAGGISETLPKALNEEKTTLSEASEEAPEDEESMSEDEILDINSIEVTIEKGPQKGKRIPLEVSFQSGNIISLLIPKKEKELVDNLSVGDFLNQIQFYSPIAIFNGRGEVYEKSLIKQGPKRGDYTLDIIVLGT